MIPTITPESASLSVRARLRADILRRIEFVAPVLKPKRQVKPHAPRPESKPDPINGRAGTQRANTRNTRTDVSTARLVELRKSGLSCKQIAAMVGMCTSGVSRRIREGLTAPVAQERIYQFSGRELLDALHDGKSLAQQARERGCTLALISFRLRQEMQADPALQAEYEAMCRCACGASKRPAAAACGECNESRKGAAA